MCALCVIFVVNASANWNSTYDATSWSNDLYGPGSSWNSTTNQSLYNDIMKYYDNNSVFENFNYNY